MMKIRQLKWEFQVRYWIAYGLHITYIIYEYGPYIKPNSAFIRCEGITDLAGVFSTADEAKYYFQKDHNKRIEAWLENDVKRQSKTKAKQELKEFFQKASFGENVVDEFLKERK